MNRISVGIIVLAIIGLAGIAAANKAVEGEEPAMMVSPSTIVLDKVDTITVHTNIPFRTFVGGSIELNNIPATSVFPDNCGHLVAKFLVEALQLDPDVEEMPTLTLTGKRTDGSSFSATDQVRVR
jgi:hypothetical protein